MAEPITPQNIGESLKGLRIADYYTSLFHVSGADLTSLPKNDVYTGNGRLTGISLSAVGDRVIINRYIEPVGWDTGTTYDPINGTMEWLDAFFPINSIMLTATNDNPSNRIAGTKWAQEAGGKFLVGVGEGTDQNDPAYSYNFSPGFGGASSGDIAGEYCVRLNANELPAHTHDVNSELTTIGSFDTSTTFCFYFGDTVNPQGLTQENNTQRTHGRRLLSNAPYFLEQDRIEAFQNNTSYDGQDNYRTWLIQQRHADGYTYTDSDFNSKLGNYSLAGWGGSVVGGPGWGGLLLDNDTRAFIGNSPRPVDVPYTVQDGSTVVLEASYYDPRDNDRVHPGQFGSQDLIRARNIIVDVLGEDEAAIALEGVNRLRELDAEVVAGIYSSQYTSEQIPGNGVVRTTSTTGFTECHNNILPSYGVYVWRRVPLDYIIPLPPVTLDTPGSPEEPETTETMWRGTITTNRKELNLNAWARDRGWNGISPATITVNNSVYIYSDNTSKPGLTTGEWPNGLTLINNGFIMGRGGDGGSFAYGHPDYLNGPEPGDCTGGDCPGGRYWDGWAGGDAIFVNTTSAIVINNMNGAIGGGGGGGASTSTGHYGGGGGGAGGGAGGIGWSPGNYELGGQGGAPGRPGDDGENWRRSLTYSYQLQGRGGQAGGGGAGGIERSGADPHGGGGGGGRVLSVNATGGNGGEEGGGGGLEGGGEGGSGDDPGQTVSNKKKGRWGNAAGGGGWGADGGDCLNTTNRGVTKGGKGGKAVKSIDGANYTVNGGLVYGTKS